MKVHRTLGAGFLEAIYEEALEKEFKKQNIPFQRQVKLDVFYESEKLNKFYKADFICFNEIIIEIKSVQMLPAIFYSQLKNYLSATKKELGLLVNFGELSLNYKRILNPNLSL